MKNIVLTAGLLLATAMLIIGQSQYISLVRSTVSVAGSSNVHDWESNVKTVKVSGSLAATGGELTGINSLKVVIPVTGIVSTKGSIMDDKTWSSLKYKSHPNIIYTMSKVNSIKDNGGGNYYVSTSGNLSIAGVTKYVSVNATAKSLGNGQYQFVGSKDLTMTMFGIEPPTAMFGAMTTSNNITIKYNLTLKESDATQ